MDDLRAADAAKPNHKGTRNDHRVKRGKLIDPDLTEEQVGAAAIYAEAYPCRDFRHKRPAKWKIKPRISKTEKLDTLLRVS